MPLQSVSVAGRDPVDLNARYDRITSSYRSLILRLIALYMRLCQPGDGRDEGRRVRDFPVRCSSFSDALSDLHNYILTHVIPLGNRGTYIPQC